MNHKLKIMRFLAARIFMLSLICAALVGTAAAGAIPQAPTFHQVVPYVSAPPAVSAFAIGGGEPSNISYPGQKLTGSFTVAVTASNLTGQKGDSYRYTECDSFVIYNTTSSTQLSVVYNTTPQTLTTSPYTSSFTYTPQTAGIYTFGAACETATSIYTASNNTWSAWSPWAVLPSEQLNVIQVVNPSSPPPPPPISIGSILSAIANFLGGLLGHIGL